MPEKRGVKDDWDDMLYEERTGCCARCKQPLPKKGTRTAVIYDLGDRRMAL